jgi:DNA (cytosine-5)-methyltransferase 1
MNKNKEKVKVIDLFAGAGGFGLGFHMASKRYKIMCSLEVDDWAVSTLKFNNLHNQRIIHRDIRDFLSSEDILSVCSSKPDIIIGGPPCQGFSFAGPVKDPRDPRNTLFKNFAFWVQVLRPKVFIMENVRGILNGKNEKGEKIINIIVNTFISIGYKIDIWELNAANYGVPQNRERIFIVGNIYDKEISKPPITHYLPEEKGSLNGTAQNLKKAINVINAIGDLPKLKSGEGLEEAPFTKIPRNEFQKMIRGKTKILYNHVTMLHTKRIILRYEHILRGVKYDEIPLESKVRERNGKGKISTKQYSSNYRHLRPSMVSHTIPASFYSSFVHPNQPRNLTSREAARLQSFPDSYVFKGKRTQVSSKLLKQLGKSHENHLSQYNQIGNAVPPLLSKAIAQQILKFLDGINE